MEHDSICETKAPTNGVAWFKNKFFSSDPNVDKLFTVFNFRLVRARAYEPQRGRRRKGSQSVCKKATYWRAKQARDTATINRLWVEGKSARSHKIFNAHFNFHYTFFFPAVKRKLSKNRTFMPAWGIWNTFLCRVRMSKRFRPRSGK